MMGCADVMCIARILGRRSPLYTAPPFMRQLIRNMTRISITPASQYLLPAGQYLFTGHLVNIFLLSHDLNLSYSSQSISLTSWSISFYCHMTWISITPASQYLLQAGQYLSIDTWPVNISYQLVNIFLLSYDPNLNYSSQSLSLTSRSISLYYHMTWTSITANISYMLVNIVLLPHALKLNYSSQSISLANWSIYFIVTWPETQLLQQVNISYLLVNIFLLTHDQSISLISWSISFYCHMTQISITPASHYLLQAIQYLSTTTWPEPQLPSISLTCWSIWFYCHMPWISITPAGQYLSLLTLDQNLSIYLTSWSMSLPSHDPNLNYSSHLIPF